MKSGEKDGRTATGLSLIVKELAVRLKWEGEKGEKRESQESCWRRSRYWGALPNRAGGVAAGLSQTDPGGASTSCGHGQMWLTPPIHEF